MAELWNHYNLDPEVLGITDFGETKKIYGEFEERRHSAGKSTDTTLADYEEFVENEDIAFQELEEAFDAEGNNPKITAIKKSIGVATIEDEDADKVALLKERHRSTASIRERLPTLRNVHRERSTKPVVPPPVSIYTDDLPRIIKESTSSPPVSTEEDVGTDTVGMDWEEEKEEGAKYNKTDESLNINKESSFAKVTTEPSKNVKSHQPSNLFKTPVKPTEVIDLVSDDDDDDNFAMSSASKSSQGFQKLFQSGKKHTPVSKIPTKLSKESKQAEKEELQRQQEIQRFNHFKDEDGKQHAFFSVYGVKFTSFIRYF